MDKCVSMFSASLAILVTTTVQAQSLKPQVYFWQPEPASFTHQPVYYEALISTTRDNSEWPQLTAEEAINQIAAAIVARQGAGTFGPDDQTRIGILLYGFGAKDSQTTSLYSSLDALTIGESDWPAGGGSEGRDNRIQPWATNAISNAHEWMVEFCDRWQHNSTLQSMIPARFHFDTEIPFAGSGQTANYTYLLYAAFNDSRWNDPAYPVPGFGTQTAHDLYEAAWPVYGWPSQIDDSTNGGIVRTAAANDPRNRPIMLWWNSICDQARSAAMDQAAYQVLRQTWPNVEVSNYDEATTDNAIDSTSWFLLNTTGLPDLPDSETGCYPVDQPARAPSVSFPRARIDPAGGGATMYEESGNGNLVGRWFTHFGQSFGTLAAPQLYYVECPHVQRAMYHSPSDVSLKPFETDWQASLRVARHNIEAIIDTPGTQNSTEVRVSPWVPYLTETGGPDYVGREQVRSLLSMLRAKNVPELLAWSNDDPNHSDQDPSAIDTGWAIFDRIYRQVYAPQLYNYKVARGTEPAGQTYDNDRLAYTLRRDGAPYMVQVNAAVEGTSGISDTEVWVKFDHVNDLATDDFGLRFNVECSADEADVAGFLFAYNFQTGAFDLVAPDDATATSGYSFNTPSESFLYEARPTFRIKCDQLAKYVSGDAVLIKLLHLHSGTPFKSYYDLVQLTRDDCCEEQNLTGNCRETLVVPLSDFNYDGVIDDSDLIAYLAKWTMAEASADVNADGVVDEADLQQFMAATASGS